MPPQLQFSELELGILTDLFKSGRNLNVICSIFYALRVRRIYSGSVSGHMTRAAISRDPEDPVPIEDVDNWIEKNLVTGGNFEEAKRCMLKPIFRRPRRNQAGSNTKVGEFGFASEGRKRDAYENLRRARGNFVIPSTSKDPSVPGESLDENKSEGFSATEKVVVPVIKEEDHFGIFYEGEEPMFDRPQTIMALRPTHCRAIVGYAGGENPEEGEALYCCKKVQPGSPYKFCQEHYSRFTNKDYVYGELDSSVRSKISRERNAGKSGFPEKRVTTKETDRRSAFAAQNIAARKAAKARRMAKQYFDARVRSFKTNEY